MNSKYLGFGDKALAKHNLGKEPANWENGLRLNPHRSSFEQWYVGAQFDDGTVITARFGTKLSPYTLTMPNPTVSIDITMADGTVMHRRFCEGAGKALNASHEYCDVNISGSYLRREHGGRYNLYYIDDQIEYSAVIDPTLPMWRPGTGHISPDGNGRYFAWLVAAPHAEITATLRIGGNKLALHGAGYMDHIWGNVDAHQFADHWYLCRGSIDGYTVICSDLVARDDKADEDDTHITLMYAAKDGKVILDGSRICTVERSETFVHPTTKRFYDSVFDFSCTAEDGTVYNALFEHKQDIETIAPPTLLSRAFQLFGKHHSRLCSRSALSLTITDPQGNADSTEGHGIMVQVSYTPLPQAKPGEYIGGQWPPEEAQADTGDRQAESSPEDAQPEYPQLTAD